MIPIFSLIRQNKRLEKEYSAIFHQFLDHGVAILGPKVSEFEKAFADFIGVKYAVGVASGTDAITLALLALGIGKGDEVILPANAYPSVFGVAATGATIVLTDIHYDTFTMDPESLSRVITPKTRAILPVHLYGRPADMERIVNIAQKHGIPVIEDCAQAVGAEVKINEKWKKVGSIGDIGCFSFYPTKNLGALGDGGMVVTNDKHLAERLKLFRMYGEKGRYQSVLVGKNSRLDELQAAILLLKLTYLDDWNSKRKEISRVYDSYLHTKRDNPRVQSVDHLFVVRSKNREKFQKELEKEGIQTAIHYPVSIHLVPSFAHLGYTEGDFPESEKASREVISLPLFPEMTSKEVEKVGKTTARFLR